MVEAVVVTPVVTAGSVGEVVPSARLVLGAVVGDETGEDDDAVANSLAHRRPALRPTATILSKHSSRLRIAPNI